MRASMKQWICVVALAFLLSGAVPAMADTATVKNVIIMIPGGCSSGLQTLARLYKGSDLNIDPLVSGMVKTGMANSVITDSAAAATAFSSGHKTTNRFLGIGPNPYDLLTGTEATADPYAPLGTVLEGARLLDKSTGLVATSRISASASAAFAAHVEDKDLENEIMEQLVYNSIDVVFGGGGGYLIPAGTTYTTVSGNTWSGKRTDGENLMDTLGDRGYSIVDNSTDMMALTTGPVWGMFDESHMAPDLDRDDLAPEQPSLAEMTEKAIELLSQDEDGFMLVVEGSQINWAAHANDPVYMTTDFIAFDDAVGKAIAFAETNEETLVLIYPAHDSGGLTIGHEMTDFPPPFTATTLEDVIAPIEEATVTWQELLNHFPLSLTPAKIRALFENYQGGWWSRMTDLQAQDLINIFRENFNDPAEAYYPIARYLSNHFTVFGWTTHGNTGGDVPLYSYGPSKPVGLFDNTDLADMAAWSMDIELDLVTKKLYAAATDLPQTVSIDVSSPKNPVIVIDEYRFPVNKDYVIMPDETILRLGGITVYTPSTGKFYLPGTLVYKFRVADIYGIDIF